MKELLMFSDRPLAFFDIEATGTDVARDRIVSLHIKAVYPDGQEQEKSWLVNPGFSMSDEVIAIHGITNEMVMASPRFESVAQEIHLLLMGCDLATFNGSNFDIPLLWEEFYRAGIRWNLDGVRHIDVGNLFKKMEPRTLTAAVKFYCGRSHDGAHDAAADVQATMEVFENMLERERLHDDMEIAVPGMRNFLNDYSDLAKLDIPGIAEFSKMDDRVDLAGKIVRKDGVAIYNFGKAKGTPVTEDPGFGQWMLRNDFTENTKQVVRSLLNQQPQLV